MLSTKKKFRIAIFGGTGVPSHRAATRKLYRLLSPKGDEDVSLYEPRVYTVCTTKESMRKKIELAVVDQCDVFVINGQSCAVIFAEICKEIGVAVPTIYVGVQRPDRLGLVDSLERPGNQRTAVSGEIDRGEGLAACIALFKGYISRIFIPYKPGEMSGEMEHKAHALRVALENHGFLVETQPIVTSSEALALIRGKSKDIDAVVTIEACVTNGASEIIKFTADNDKILFCGYGFTGIELGAPCAYGGDIELLSNDVCALLDLHCMDGVPLGDVPVRTVPYQRYFIVNRVMLLQTGMSKAILDVLEKAGNVMIVRHYVKLSG